MFVQRDVGRSIARIGSPRDTLDVVLRAIGMLIDGLVALLSRNAVPLFSSRAMRNLAMENVRSENNVVLD